MCTRVSHLSHSRHMSRPFHYTEIWWIRTPYLVPLNSNIRTIRIDVIFQLARSVKVKTTLDLTIVYNLRCIKIVSVHGLKVRGRGERRYSAIHSYFRHFMKISQLHVPAALLQGKRAPGTHWTGAEGGGSRVGPIGHLDALDKRFNSCSRRESNQDLTDILSVSLVITPTEQSRLLLWCLPNRTRKDTVVTSYHTHVSNKYSLQMTRPLYKNLSAQSAHVRKLGT